jgi:hypothetical protein
MVESLCRYGDATDEMHCVENYFAGKLTSRSGILLHTVKIDNFFLCNVLRFVTACVLSFVLSCCLVGGYRLLGRTFLLDLDHEY